MGFVEKMRELESKLDADIEVNFPNSPVLREIRGTLSDCLPEILAVVEAARDAVSEMDDSMGMQFDPTEDLRPTLAALDKKAGEVG